MRKEILRVSDLSAKRNIGCDLKHIHMYLYEGEVLGMVGLHDSGKTFLLDCIMGDSRADSGMIYLNEEMTEVDKWRGSDKIYRIRPQSSLVERCSVMESVFVVRKQRKNKLFIPWNAIKHQATACLQEFGIEIDPKQIVASLSLVERHMVEILKGYVSGAKLILIDDVLTPYSVADYRILCRVIQKFQEKGISFIICGCQLENLQRLSERCLFMVNGRPIKVIENLRRNQIDEMKIFMAGGEKTVKRDYKAKKNTNPNAKVLLEAPFKVKNKEQTEPLFIKEGEVVVVVDTLQDKTGEIINALSRGRKGKLSGLIDGKNINRRSKDFYLADFLHCNYMIESLTFRDNLCIAAYKRIATIGFINPIKTKVVERLFRERYQIKAEHFEFDWGDMSFVEKMAVYLERIKIQRWKIMFCTNIENVMSYELEDMVKDELLGMIKGRKRAICIFAASFEKYVDFADYFLLPVEGEILKFSYRELKDFFGI